MNRYLRGRPKVKKVGGRKRFQAGGVMPVVPTPTASAPDEDDPLWRDLLGGGMFGAGTVGIVPGIGLGLLQRAWRRRDRGSTAAPVPAAPAAKKAGGRLRGMGLARRGHKQFPEG